MAAKNIPQNVTITSTNNQLFSTSSSKCGSNAGTSRIQYIYELPYNARKQLCDLLDADQSWRQLGGQYMGLNDTQLSLISHALLRNSSPTNDLLAKLDTTNAKISQLYLYLAQMGHKRAMFLLRPFVDPRLKQLCPDLDSEDDNYDVSAIQAIAATLNPSMSITNQFQNSFDNKSLNYSSNSAKLYSHNPPKYESIHTITEKKILNKNLNFDSNVTNKSNNNDLSIKKNNFGCDSHNKNSSQPDQSWNEMEVPYKELLLATDDFAKERILGNGGFGIVYKGEWKGTNVAIKRLKGFNDISQALTEMKVLNRYRIDNILPIYGVSLDGGEPCLVYQYMPNGSLEDRLLCKANTRPLSWSQRLNIGEGISRALNYLHTLTGSPFVHGDVKSANVLLDQLYEPKLGDFGLARQVSTGAGLYTHCTVSAVHGTSVYLPFEYLRQKILSPAVDVYSYGIVMLEMATGKRAFDGKRLLIDAVEDEIKDVDKSGTRDYSKLMDKRMTEDSEPGKGFEYLLELGRKCAHKSKAKRPTMVQVLEYYSQFKTSERIRRLSAQAHKNEVSISKSNIKTPLELQLWYDMVRKTGGVPTENSFPAEHSQDNDHQLIFNSEMFSNNIAINVELVDDHELNEQTSDCNNDISSPLIPLITELGVSPQNNINFIEEKNEEKNEDNNEDNEEDDDEDNDDNEDNEDIEESN